MVIPMLHVANDGRRVWNTATAAALLGPELMARAYEEFHVLHLDQSLALIGRKAYAAGGASTVDVPMRRLIRDALTLDSRALILAHNHPDDVLAPSRADKAVTKRIVEMARTLEIIVLDHLIFGRSEWVSFRREGLI